MVKVCDQVISLLRLDRLFGLSNQHDQQYFFVVVVGNGSRRIGLMVDNLLGEDDVVIKPLQERYSESPGIAGATILGDGQVALILDVSKLLDLGLECERISRSIRRQSQHEPQQE